MHSHKKFIGAFVAVAIISLAIAAWSKKSDGDMPPKNEPVVCTMDAKICPDGSSVGRIAPNCEFAACPTSQNSQVESAPAVTPSIDVENVRDEAAKVTFSYPATFNTKYITPEVWPPVVEVKKEAYKCPAFEISPGSATEQKQKIINGKTYCVLMEGEGAAGSTYMTYTYSRADGAQTLLVRFTARLVQCANYDAPKRAECEKERTTFSPDSIGAQILSSAKVQ